MTPVPSDLPPPGTDAHRIRRWRRLNTAARVLWWLLVAAGVLLALTQLLLHQVLVPRIEQYRPRLEQQASALLGVPVRIGAVSARARGWVPSFELQEVSLLGPDGQVALRLPKVIAAVSARSVWSLGFEQIYVEAPELDVRRDAQGRIRVAGLLFGPETQSHSAAADWFFAQAEFVIRQGVLHWTDELRSAPVMTLSGVNLVVRNPGLHHRIYLEATPQADWGGRFVAQADFSHALWETEEGNWRRWTGDFFVQLGRVDVGHLRRQARLGIPVEQGRGAARVWGRLDHGVLKGMTADVALEGVSAKLGPQLPPLELATLSGRLGGAELADGGFEFFTEGLDFTTTDGVKWPGGNVHVRQQTSRLTSTLKGEARADRLDLTTLAQVANRLPLGEGAHAWLKRWAPRGMIDSLQANWTGPVEAAQDWALKGRVSGLAIAAEEAAQPEKPGRPGVQGLSLDFDASQAGGSARVLLRNGGLVFPGVFEHPAIPVDELQGQLRWTVSQTPEGVDAQVQLEQLKFSTPHVQGDGQIRWRTADAGRDGGGRFPGVLDLEMALHRADGTQVYRYLPLGIPKATRDYVQAAVLQGHSTDVRARVKGPLQEFPFGGAASSRGEFRIAAQIRDAHYAYVPSTLAPAGKPGWPALTGLSGLLVFDRNSMEVKNATAQVHGVQKLLASKVQASIASLAEPVVKVSGEIRGPLAEQLAVVRQSALNELTHEVLARATGSGEAATHLQMELPLAKLNTSHVQGKITLGGNDVRISPDTPMLGRVRAQVAFSEKGFSFKGAQARFLGGDLKLDGGTVEQAGATDATVVLRGQGQATAQGLRDARELGLVSQLARGASGQLGYQATLGFRRGQPEISVSSNLQGLALALPQPMSKPAEQALPLRYVQALRKDSQASGPLLDEVTLEVAGLVRMHMVRDLGAAPLRVLRGVVAVGEPAGRDLAPADSGFAAHLALDRLDLDAWDAVLQSDAVAAPAYWPSTMALRARELVLGGRRFNHVVVGGSREGGSWRANMNADELNGYVEFRQAQGNVPGHLFARLARLSLAATAATDIEMVLDQPSSVPALDVVVEDLEYKGHKLGRLEVDAVNQGNALAREWRLRKLNLSMPEAQFAASGNWVRTGAQATTPTQGARSRNPQRRTALKFKLDIHDSGRLLQRLGMGELIRKTPGVMEGQIAWVGSPLALDYPTLQGQFNVDLREGQFLKVEPGVARLLGVLSLQSLPRRLALDFRDVFSEGFAFDTIRGDIAIENGIAKTNNLQMKGVVAGVLMEGSANIARETQDLRVVVVPEINAGTASLFAAAVNPVIGLGSFLAQAIVRRPLIRSATQEFKVEGSWSDPRITKVDPRAEPAGSPPAGPTPNAGVSQ